MNLPNKLTVFRVILIVPFVLLLLGGYYQWDWFCACFGAIVPYTDVISVVIFIIASLTDFLDGKIARKYNLVTNFGKFMDPLADKLLVCSALICLVAMDRLAAWIVIIIIAREFIISGFRLIASDNGIVIAASYWGKFKTTFQMLMVIVLILNIQTTVFYWLGVVLTYVALALTVISLVDYIAKNKNVLKEQK
jgi:CDP-diacylglycerol--glycerol-3-phosphate 3-phosphatidyltransferase